MFVQSQRTLDQMYQVWQGMDSTEKEVTSREIFDSLSANDQYWIRKKTVRWGRGFGGGSYVNLLLTLILHPMSRLELEKLWKEG